MLQTHYDTLGVSSTASQKDIQQAYAKLRKELDAAGDKAGVQRLGPAYTILRDRRQRANYDAQIGITETEEKRRQEEERERQERERRERQEREERERQEREERERQEREERERQEREERERQEREERERQEREEPERQEREEPESQRPRSRRRWLIPVCVVGSVIVILVAALAGWQGFGDWISIAAPAPIPTRSPTVALIPAGTSVPTDMAAAIPTVTPMPTDTLPPPAPTPTRPVPPAQPARLTVVAISHDSVALSWDNPRDPSIIGYQILRRNQDIDAPGVFVVIREDTGIAATTYEDNTAQPETRYVYRIKARNGAGLSKQSSYVNVNTPAAPTPTPTVIPTPAPTPTPTVIPTPTVSLVGWTTLATLSETNYQSRQIETRLAACVAGNFKQHQRGQHVPFSNDGSYGRNVPMVVVNVVVAGVVEPQHCYTMRLQYIIDDVYEFCDDDPYGACDPNGGAYWERRLPLFRLITISNKWELPP